MTDKLIPEMHNNVPCQDSIVEDIIRQLRERSEHGLRKYGTTVDRTDLSEEQWLQHALEEGMDKAVYLRRVQIATRRMREQYEATIEKLRSAQEKLTSQQAEIEMLKSGGQSVKGD